MNRQIIVLITLLIGGMMISQCGKQPETAGELIPLPEHPRPDFERPDWFNLNGRWDFSLDSLDTGESNGWHMGDVDFKDSITVPFSWASPFSGIGRKDVHIGWYARDLKIPEDWRSGSVFIVIGACDCVTTAWLNGKLLGSHEGGYTPFEFDLTGFLNDAGNNRLVLRVEDRPTPGRLVGKQVYGEAKGIWQTVYLEARNAIHITRAHFLPDIDRKLVILDISISKPASDHCGVAVSLPGIEQVKEQTNISMIPPGAKAISFEIPIESPRLWTLEDPFLYEAEIQLKINDDFIDHVHTYFGMRKIGTARLPGSSDMYITLNDKPVYLKMALDQSYHPDGYYTFPTDSFMRGEIERAKAIGLNGLRIHIKSEMPRKLYWADKLGFLIMADIPNIGGQPDEYGRKNWEYTATRQIDRDFNHPSIFSWVLFNETWGLYSRKEVNGKTTGGYFPETQEWVRSLYRRTKELDPTRLVEDNSPAQGGGRHVESDINSWHVYIAGHKWKSYLDMVVKNTYPGSSWNYMESDVQTDIPMMNSECGAVWGYHNGTGDVDLSYEYHIMMNEFRRRPKICGFIFTEFHDVINEWNGYYRFDRSMKEYGLDELCPGMTVSDFHSDLYLVVGDDFNKTVKPGGKFTVPVTASLLSGSAEGTMTVRTLLHGWNRFGEHKTYAEGSFDFEARKYETFSLDPVKLTAPEEDCIAVFSTTLVNDKGEVMNRNFVPVRVSSGDAPRKESIAGEAEIVRCAPDTYTAGEWSVRQKSIMDGLKVWGTGTGFFEYEFRWPENLSADDAAGAEFIAELSARRIQGKDMHEKFVRQSIGDVTTKGIDPGHYPNSYPMTDLTRHPSAVAVTFNDTDGLTVVLENDPGDHRGLLSWLSQKPDRPSDHPDYNSWLYRNSKSHLHEAGSYGYLVRVGIGTAALRKAEEEGVVRVRLAVDEATEHSGGLAVYGEKFGRYPLDPTVVIRLKD